LLPNAITTIVLGQTLTIFQRFVTYCPTLKSVVALCVVSVAMMLSGWLRLMFQMYGGDFGKVNTFEKNNLNKEPNSLRTRLFIF
jgi:uncharacterized membrane protein